MISKNKTTAYGLVVTAVFLMAAPFWAPHIQIVYDRRTFLEADAMVLLGLTLLTGLAGALIYRPRTGKAMEGAGGGLSRHATVILAVFLPLLALALVALNRQILHSFMNSADEHSCYFLAECLRMGRWWVETHPLSEFFDVVHVGNRDGKWFSVYPPGWPALMAIGIQFGMTDWLNPVLSSASLFFLYLTGRELFGIRTAVLAVFLTAATPFFAFTSASYYSHSTCLLAMTVFAYAFLKWQRATTERRAIRWAVLGAVAIGYGLATRYLTMAAFSAPFMIHALWPVITRKRGLRKSEWIAAGIILFFMAIVLFQNYSVTGKPFKAPNRYDKSWERLGFNENYNPIDGIVFIFARFFYLMDWAPPFWTLLFLAGIGPLARKLSGTVRLFALSFFFPVIAYFFYFSWGGNQYGPRYWYEGFPFMMLAASTLLTRGWQEGKNAVKGFLLAAGLFSLVVAGYQFYKHGTYFEEVSRQRKDLYTTAENQVKKPAVVFIKGFLGDKLVMSQEDAVRNPPTLDAPILYAHDRGEANKKVKAHFPERHFYRGSYDRKDKSARLNKLEL